MMYEGTELCDPAHESSHFMEAIDVDDPSLWSSDNSEGEAGIDEINHELSSHHTIRENNGDLNLAKRQKKSNKREVREKKLPPILAGRLQEAQILFYKDGALDSAMSVLRAIVREEPGVADPWLLMAEIEKSKGDIKRQTALLCAAATISGNDHALWQRCAQLSINIDDLDQADQCLKAAIRTASVRPESRKFLLDYYWQRYQLANRMHRGTIAFNCLREAHRNFPRKKMIIKALAQIYVQKRRHAEAISLYERLFARFSSYPTPPTGDDVFAWTDLNILIELYFMANLYSDMVHKIHVIGRWLNGRFEEHFWEKFEDTDDREWDPSDERKQLIPEYQRSKTTNVISDHDRVKSNNNKIQTTVYGDRFRLPLILRIRLIIARLKLNQLSEALHQIENLDHIEVDSSIFSALFDLGDALLESKCFEQALTFYIDLYNFDEQPSNELYMSMGKCYQGLESFNDAIQCFQTILARSNDEVEALMLLAECYASTGSKNEALKVLNEILQICERLRLERRGSAEFETQQGYDIDIDGRKATAVGKYRSVQESIAALNKYSEESEDGTQIDFEVLKLDYEIQLNRMLESSYELLQEFTAMKAFFPSDRAAKFKGISRQKGRHPQGGREDANLYLDNIETRTKKLIAELSSKAQEHARKEAENELNKISYENFLETERFNGLSFDQWLKVLIDYALVLSREKNNVDEAIETLRAISKANVFYQHMHRNRVLHLAHLACALMSSNREGRNDIVRWFGSTFPGCSNSYRLHSILNRGGRAADIEAFVFNGIQKYLLRHIKSKDETLNIPHESETTNKDDIDPILLTVYAHVLLAKTSYKPALFYLSRAFTVSPKDPMISLTLAIVYLHMSMQRQTPNRHYQILQAFYFFVKYYDICKMRGSAKEQEANYNIGRAFHQLGLTTYAIQFYEEVIAISERASEQQQLETESWHLSNVKYQAAHNLVFIYLASGNKTYASRTMERYLSI